MRGRLLRRAEARDGDGGFTLVELTVAMGLLVAVLAGFLLMFFAFGTAGRNTQELSQSQSNTRAAMRQLESDVASADPLLEWPASGVPSPIGTGSVANTDEIAMYLPVDPLLPCGAAGGTVPTTSSGSLSPYSAAGTFFADVIWVYSPAAGTLSRYTYASCGGTAAWQTTPDLTLSGVVNASGTMFTQTSAGTQANLSGTVAADQAVPSCASALTVTIETKTRSETTAFKVSETIPLPNQPAVKGFACS